MKVSKRATNDRYYVFQWCGWGIFVHRLHHDEEEGIYHSHPWSWVSIVFGSYLDYRSHNSRLVRLFNWCKAGIPHRVTLPYGPVWTICIHGPRRVPWAVFQKHNDGHFSQLEQEPWRGTENPGRTTYRREA